MLLDLVLAGITEGVIETEGDLRQLYAWLRQRQARDADQTTGRTSRKTSAPPSPAPAARAGDRRRRTDSGPASSFG